MYCHRTSILQTISLQSISVELTLFFLHSLIMYIAVDPHKESAPSPSSLSMLSLSIYFKYQLKNYHHLSVCQIINKFIQSLEKYISPTNASNTTKIHPLLEMSISSNTGKEIHQICYLNQIIMKYHWIILLLLVSLSEAQSEELSPTSVKLTLIKSPESNPFSVRSIDSIFLRLPQFQEISEAILTADQLSISKLIQTIRQKEGDIDCQALTIYTDEVIGMIRVAIERNELTSNQLKIIIETAKAQIQRLEREIRRLKREQESLGLQMLRDAISPFIIELERAYDAFNRIQSRIQPKKAQIAGYEKEIEILSENANQQRVKIEKNRLNIVDYNAQIQKLQLELRNLQERKATAEDEIEDSQKLLIQIQDTIQANRASIQQLEDEIIVINERADELKKTYLDLQIDVERMRADISSAAAKEDSILLKIEMNEQKIDQEEQKVVEREYKLLQNKIRALSRSLPRFEDLSNELYYNCYGQGSIEIRITGSVTVYIIKGALLPSFLEQSYGIQRTLSISTNEDINFRLVDIFGFSWKTTYGRPFQETALVTENFFITNDFTCLNPSKIKSGNGVILDIKNNRMQVKVGNGVIRLIIGACSRIESRQHLPKVGNTIFFKGVFINRETVNLYAASCF